MRVTVAVIAAASVLSVAVICIDGGNGRNRLAEDAAPVDVLVDSNVAGDRDSGSIDSRHDGAGSDAGNPDGPPAGTFTTVDIGRHHARAISEGGQLHCWGLALPAL